VIEAGALLGTSKKMEEERWVGRQVQATRQPKGEWRKKWNAVRSRPRQVPPARWRWAIVRSRRGHSGRVGRYQTAKRAKSTQLGAKRGGSALLVAVGAWGGYTARPDHFPRARLRGVTVAVAARTGWWVQRWTGQDGTGRTGEGKVLASSRAAPRRQAILHLCAPFTLL
jgi:hypothetical protein